MRTVYEGRLCSHTHKNMGSFLYSSSHFPARPILTCILKIFVLQTDSIARHINNFNKTENVVIVFLDIIHRPVFI
jgi:hypothetical protein